MATIKREYDDEDLIRKLLDIRPGINFGAQSEYEIEEIDVDLYTGRTPFLEVTVKIPVTRDELNQILSNPSR